MSKHFPSFQFYPADWIKDPKLQRCSRATKGMWIDIICYLHESETRGKISATFEEWCRLARCSAEEFNDFLSENKQKKFANISERNGLITVKNRRMVREEKARQGNNERQRRHRKKKNNDQNNEDVTEKVTPYSSSSTSVNKKRNVILSLQQKVSEIVKWYDSFTSVPNALNGEKDRIRLEALIDIHGVDDLIKIGEEILRERRSRGERDPNILSYLITCWENPKAWKDKQNEDDDPYKNFTNFTEERLKRKRLEREAAKQ